MIRSTLRGDQHLLVGDDVDLGVQRVDRSLRGLDLALPHPVRRVDDLTLEVADVDDVEVDDADRPDPGGREIQRTRRSEPTGADEEGLRAEQLRLAGRSDLRDEQMAAVALLLLRCQHDRGIEGEARTLPRLEPAGHRRDVGVAHLGEGLRREQRADTASAVQDDLGVAIGGDGFDLLLDVALGDVGGAGHMALLPLRRLADVDDDRGAGCEGIHVGRGDFTDLGASLSKEVRVGLWHWGSMDSDGRRAGGAWLPGRVRVGEADSTG